MEEALNLSLEQKLQQRLSPLQVRYVKLLEMTGPEVEEEVRHELEENPALEISENEPATEENEFAESAEEMQLADYRNEEEIPSGRREASNISSGKGFIEPLVVDNNNSLIDYLSAQLAEHHLSSKQRLIALNIIGSLDDNGYLTRGTGSLASDIETSSGIPITPREVREVLSIVKSMDPPGIGAVDLRECLLLQLKRKKQSKATALATEIVTHYFDLLSLNHFDELVSLSGAKPEELQAALDTIKTLNPKPAGIVGQDIAEERMRHIIPDFQVDLSGDNQLTLTLLNNIPELQIEETFRVAETEEDNPEDESNQRLKDAKLFIRQKYDEASSFIKILRQRQDTLFNVMKAIMTLQQDFFLSNDDESLLHPMILKDIAQLTGYDLSVISRATAGKYVTTNFGTYPLKMFFNEKARESDDASLREVLATMKELIDREDKRQPLTDEALMEAMEERGHKIARRTIAKYRDRLGVPVARLRKKW